MAEDLYINAGSKTEKYRALLPQLKNLLAGEDDLIANLANVTAALKETFHIFWTDSLYAHQERPWCLRHGMG